MRFLIGLALGFAGGFAGVILFASDRTKRNEALGPAADSEAGAPTNGNRGSMGAFRKAVRSLKGQVNEAMTEAKQASAKAEEELRARYEQMAKRANGGRK